MSMTLFTNSLLDMILYNIARKYCSSNIYLLSLSKGGVVRWFLPLIVMVPGLIPGLGTLSCMVAAFGTFVCLRLVPIELRPSQFSF